MPPPGLFGELAEHHRNGERCRNLIFGEDCVSTRDDAFHQAQHGTIAVGPMFLKLAEIDQSHGSHPRYFATTRPNKT